jgi:hypothetical protein
MRSAATKLGCARLPTKRTFLHHYSFSLLLVARRPLDQRWGSSIQTNGTISTYDDNKYAMKGVTWDNGITGSTYFESAELDKPWQQWHIYGITDSDYYILRTKDAGQRNFMVAWFTPDSDVKGQTSSTMIRGNLTDDSVY